MSKQLKTFIKTIDDDIKKLEQWKDFFDKKIEDQSGPSFEKDENNWSIAYKSPYSEIEHTGSRTTTSSDGNNEVSIPHSQKKMIDDIYRQIAKMNDMANVMATVPKIMKSELQNSFKRTNLEIKEGRELYESTDANYKLGRNMSEATGILKIDSYDRNIEENFYIMYYLLSYGVLGFFIYKLLKL